MAIINSENDAKLIDNDMINTNSSKGDFNNLTTWKGFIKYESSYVALMFLELFWVRLDTVIASFYFTESEIATQTSWGNVIMIIDCISYGFGLAMSSTISIFIVKLDIYNAKKSAFVANSTIFLIGIVLAVFLYIYSADIAAVFINDPVTRDR